MTKISTAIFSIYIATLLYLVVPFVKTFTLTGKDASGLFWNHIAIFIIFFLVAFFTLSKHISSYGGRIQMFFGFIAFLGLVLTVLYHIVPIAPVYKLPSILSHYFLSDSAYTAWLIAPLIVLFF